MRSFLRTDAVSATHSNIILVFGGNGTRSRRIRFRKFARENLQEYKVLFPETALKNVVGDEQFSYNPLHEFEKLIANISACLLIFPESPGSIAELGMFSMIPNIAKKTLVCLDRNHTEHDSFILTGPVDLIDRVSDFKKYIEIDYKQPEFSRIRTRIETRATGVIRNYPLDIGTWATTEDFTKFVIIHWMVDVARIVDIECVRYLMDGLFDAHASLRFLESACSILLGSRDFAFVDEERGLFCKSGISNSFVKSRAHPETQENELRFDILNFYADFPDFDDLVRKTLK